MAELGTEDNPVVLDEIVVQADQGFTYGSMKENIPWSTINVPQPEVQESTFGDYMNILSPFGVQGANEQTRSTVEDFRRTGLDFNDVAFKSVFDNADVESQREMLTARNNSDAMKILERRQIFNESARRTAQDGLMTQIAMGAIPALASPTTLIPFGGVFKAAQVARKARTLQMVLAGAGTTTVANLADEAMLDSQGMPTNYLGVGATSMVLGGGLGLFGAMLTSPKTAAMAADNILATGNKLDQEFVNDNFVTIDRGTETLLIPKMDETLYDKIPGLGEWFRSPITRMYQSENPAVRAIASRISNPTVAMKDAEGNFIILPRTGADVKQEIIGNFNSRINVPISELYAQWRAAGWQGSRAEFNQEIYRVYTEESTRLASGARAFSDENAVVDIAKIDEQFKGLYEEAKMDEAWYKASDGTLQPYTPEMMTRFEEHTAAVRTAEQELATFRTEGVDQLKADNQLIIQAQEAILRAEGLEGAALRTAMKEFRAERAGILKGQIADRRLELQTTVRDLKATRVPEPILRPVPADKLEARLAELRTQRAAERDAAREKWVQRYYDENPPQFKTTDKIISEGAATYAKYFDDMLEKAQNLNIKELMNSSKGRLYAPRNWDFDAIAKMPKEMVLQKLRAAIQSDSRNVYDSQKALEADVEDLYRILVDKNTQSVMGQGKGYYTKDLPFEKRLSERKLYVDESKLGNLVHNNFEDVAGMYNYFMSGRMAVQHAFSDAITKEGDLDLSMVTKDVGAEDIKIVTNTIDDLLGVRRMNQYGNDTSWKLSRNLMTYNSARLMGGAGGNQLIEMATIAMMNASRGIMSKSFGQSAQNVAKMLYKEKGAQNDLGKILLNSGYLESALHAHRANRIADTEAGFNPKLVERTLDNLADFQMKYNGQRYFTALAEDLSGGAIMEYIKRASPRDEAIFSRWGLSMDDVRELKAIFDVDDAKFLDRMTDKQIDKFQLAVNRGVAEWVVQPNSIHLPDWFKGAGPTQKLLFQFMKFPMIAQETLLRRGWTEDRAGMIAGVVGAVTMYTTLKYLREEASVALGLMDERDRKYDIFNDRDHMARALMESTNYVANLGMLTTAWNYGNAALQRPELGREWANRNAIEAIGGPTVGLVQDLSDTASRIVNRGDFTSEQQMKAFKQFTPFMAIPLLSEGVRTLAETYGD